MKGFDMQTAQSGQTCVWLQIAAFYILKSAGLSVQQTKQNMANYEIQKTERLHTECRGVTVHAVCAALCIYLIFEAVYRNHIHHDDVIGKRLKPR